MFIAGGNSAAATSVAMPNHQAGDILLVFARGTAAAPAVPAAGGTVPAWTVIQQGIANSVGLTVVGFLVTAPGFTSGVFTNATHIAVVLLRPSTAGNQLVFAAARSSVGNANNTQTVVFPALTFVDLDGSSYGIRVGTRGVAVTALANPPAGWSNYLVQPAGAGALLTIHYRSGITASPTADSVTVTSSNSAYRAVTIEVQEQSPTPQSGTVSGLASAALFGAVTALKGAVARQVTGVLSAQAFTGVGYAQAIKVPGVYPPGYAPSITGQVVCGDGHLVGGVALSQFGPVTAVITTARVIPVAGLGTAQTFGAVTAKATITQQPAGLGSAQAFGAVTIRSPVTRQVTGLGSAQQFGAVSAKSVFVRAVTGIPSAQAFSTVTIVIGTVTSPNAGIPSAQQFGTVRFALRFPITGVPSAQAFGAIRTNLKRAVAGVASAQQFGAIILRTGHSVPVSGVLSAQAFGTVRPAYSIAVPGVGSAQHFGLVSFRTVTRVLVGGIPSAQAFGLVKPTFVWLLPIVPRPEESVPVVCTPITNGGIDCIVTPFGSICGMVICGDGHLAGGFTYFSGLRPVEGVILTPVADRTLVLQPVADR